MVRQNAALPLSLLRTEGLVLFAGEGAMPRRVVEKCRLLNIPVRIFSLEGKAEIAPVERVIHLSMLLKEGLRPFLSEHRIKHILFVGRIPRPPLRELIHMGTNLMRQGYGKEALAAVRGGDDAILRFAIDVLQKEGVSVYSVHDFLPEKPTQGFYGDSKAWSPDYEPYIRNGFLLLEKLSPFDVGQSLVLEKMAIVGIEGREGTDALLQRCAPFGKELIFVKAFKTGQTVLADIPTYGSRTVQNMSKHYIGMAVRGAVCADFDKTCRILQKRGKFLWILQD